MTTHLSLPQISKQRFSDISIFLDRVDPFIQEEAIDSIVFRLAGLSSQKMLTESQVLAHAILEEMKNMDRECGTLEIAIVLATIRQAFLKAMMTNCGRA